MLNYYTLLHPKFHPCCSLYTLSPCPQSGQHQGRPGLCTTCPLPGRDGIPLMSHSHLFISRKTVGRPKCVLPFCKNIFPIKWRPLALLRTDHISYMSWEKSELYLITERKVCPNLFWTTNQPGLQLQRHPACFTHSGFCPTIIFCSGWDRLRPV